MKNYHNSSYSIFSTFVVNSVIICVQLTAKRTICLTINIYYTSNIYVPIAWQVDHISPNIVLISLCKACEVLNLSFCSEPCPQRGLRG